MSDIHLIALTHRFHENYAAFEKHACAMAEADLDDPLPEAIAELHALRLAWSTDLHSVHASCPETLEGALAVHAVALTLGDRSELHDGHGMTFLKEAEQAVARLLPACTASDRLPVHLGSPFLPPGTRQGFRHVLL